MSAELHEGPLRGLRVIDLATVFAGPSAARRLADFGADVIKVERPGSGDTVRSMGWRDPSDDVTLFWKIAGRGKRTIILDLKTEEGLSVLRRLLDTADVLVENFRPGKLEALGLDPEVLHVTNPRLVVTRVTGFGQTGPYRHRPGFASIAEAMSGFANVNGEADGNPILPPIALTDEVTAIVAAFATMVAVHSGVGQVVDVNLLESMLHLMGPLVSANALTGYEQPRLGSGIPYTVPRNIYECSDGRWVVVSATAESVAQRFLEMVGVPNDPRFAGFENRVENREVIDQIVSEWVSLRTLDQVLSDAERAEVAVAPVYSMTDVVNDPHLRERDAIITVDGVPMQNVIARLSKTPGGVRFAARPMGADTEQVIAELDD